MRYRTSLASAPNDVRNICALIFSSADNWSNGMAVERGERARPVGQPRLLRRGIDAAGSDRWVPGPRRGAIPSLASPIPLCKGPGAGRQRTWCALRARPRTLRAEPRLESASPVSRKRDETLDSDMEDLLEIGSRSSHAEIDLILTQTAAVLNDWR